MPLLQKSAHERAMPDTRSVTRLAARVGDTPLLTARDLVVIPRQVVDAEEAAERRVATECGRATVTVLVDKGWQSRGPLAARSIEPCVTPARLERLDEAL